MLYDIIRAMFFVLIAATLVAVVVEVGAGLALFGPA
jgi:hypothetical protein